MKILRSAIFVILLVFAWYPACVQAEELKPTGLRCEYLTNPLGIESSAPRLSWRVESTERGQRQTACQLLVASSAQKLAADEGDLWNPGKVSGDQTVNVPYAGKPLTSRQACYWKVRVWDKDGRASDWSAPASWTMGLLQPQDWQGRWISFRDTSPLHTNREALFLPPARYYRKEFQTTKPVARALVHVSALGNVRLRLNGAAVQPDAFFLPGWSDYHQRVYYKSFDVTRQLTQGPNCLGAIITDGWYAGYVGYGLLVGYGPNKVGRYFYGKTPAWLAQLEIEYADGTRAVVATDASWQVSGEGPLREADIIMGETFDARRDSRDWDRAGDGSAWRWEPAIPAEANGSVKSVFYDTLGAREVELGFQPPKRLQAYAGPPVLAFEPLAPTRILEPKAGVYIFDLGQNFAGVVRLKVQGPAGTKIQLRYGEMLHPDGRLMTENLRRARAIDHYILRGDSEPEIWSPAFTYHGFQYVEVTGLPEKPRLEDQVILGLPVNSDTPLTGSFACSDPVLGRFWTNTVWTQRANFVELPTDCPQRDERLGWMGDAQAYIRTASYNADVAAFFTKWLDDVEEAQRDFGAYPDYCPYPMAHGSPRKTFGTAWTDAGIICPWTIWQVYGDTRVIERHWTSMTRFMDFRAATTTPEGLGVSIGNTWGDWLNVGEETPIEYIDTCYHALDCTLMAGMAEAIGRKLEAANYNRRFRDIKAAFQKTYIKNGVLTVDTQTAYVLALWIGLLPENLAAPAAAHLADKIARNDYRMATGFLGTKPLLPALTAAGHHDLAVRLFQSRKFPSWAYEVINGATTVWERWDSYTKEDGFGRHNAAMNSFSHYAFGAVAEWMFRHLAGIDTDGPGFHRLLIRPGAPTPGSNPDQKPIDWVQASYDSIHGRVVTEWKREGDEFQLHVSIPANCSATVFLPAKSGETVTENGKPLDAVPQVKRLRTEAGVAVISVESGSYDFRSKL